MYTLFIVLIVLASLLMIFIVLIQESKGGGLASNFSSSNAIMGVRKTTDRRECARAERCAVAEHQCCQHAGLRCRSGSRTGWSGCSCSGSGRSCRTGTGWSGSCCSCKIGWRPTSTLNFHNPSLHLLCSFRLGLFHAVAWQSVHRLPSPIPSLRLLRSLRLGL